MRASVVIPCRDAAATVGAAVTSAARQTCAPHEIILVDDGSTDGSANVARAALAATGRAVPLRVLPTRAGNAAAARNVAIRAATGDELAYLDADDEWLPLHLEQAAAMLDGSTDVAVMQHWIRWSPDGPVRPWTTLPVRRPTGGLSAAQFFAWFARWRTFCHSGTVVRRQAVLDAGLFDETQVRRHDFELFLRVIAGRTWAYDPRPGWRYRIDTPGAISRDNVSAQWFFLRALVKLRELYAGPDMDRLLRTQARHALAVAFTDGDADARFAAWQLATPFLGAPSRAVFLAARAFPRAFAAANRLRRRAFALAPAG